MSRLDLSDSDDDHSTHRTEDSDSIERGRDDGWGAESSGTVVVDVPRLPPDVPPRASASEAVDDGWHATDSNEQSAYGLHEPIAEPPGRVELARRLVAEAVREHLPPATALDASGSEAAEDLVTARTGDLSTRTTSVDWATDSAVFTDVSYRSDPEYVDTGDHLDSADRVIVDDGEYAWLKLAAGENDSGRRGLRPGDGARRSVATYEIDKALNLNVTPKTELIRTDAGEASLQRHAPEGARPVSGYRDADVQRMAILDYVTAQTDRHWSNYATSEDGRPAAIDNGLCLSRSAAAGIGSDFVAAMFNQPLDDDLLSSLRNHDRRQLSASLAALRVEADQVDDMEKRIEEIVSYGRITGASWPGPIFTGNQTRVIQWVE